MPNTTTSCAACKEAKAAPVPFVAYEAQMTRYDNRLHKAHMTILVIVLAFLVAIVVNNLAWLHVWNSYDVLGEESVVDVDASDGIAAYIGGNGVNNIGTDTGYYTPDNSETQGR